MAHTWIGRSIPFMPTKLQTMCFRHRMSQERRGCYAPAEWQRLSVFTSFVMAWWHVFSECHPPAKPVRGCFNRSSGTFSCAVGQPGQPIGFISRRSSVRIRPALPLSGSGRYQNRSGAIAQMGERLPCTQEVGGSIPPGSTTYLRSSSAGRAVDSYSASRTGSIPVSATIFR